MSDQILKTCEQILHEEDLNIPSEHLAVIRNEGLSVDLLQDEELIYLKIFSTTPPTLSTTIALLHNIGIEVTDLINFVTHVQKENITIGRYTLVCENPMQLINARENILGLIKSMLINPSLPNTPLLAFALLQNLPIRSIKLLVALVEYVDQLIPLFNKNMITQILLKHPDLVSDLLTLFHIKFNPALKSRKKRLAEAQKKVDDQLHAITQITEDKVMRIMIDIINAMVRTNFFLDKTSIAFKIHSQELLPHLRGIQPAIEAFVYTPGLSGVHLRMGSISRGGLRWSDRHEDFRNEVRFLMLTQEQKNSIIIPDGGKGGFIVRETPLSKEGFRKHYIDFVDALLDLVDNQKKGEILYNPQIVRYDGDDPYFVVAADKGTSDMSDTANEISLRKDYWLGDAFASGGSRGYNHKELGITAKGALKSVERYFIEQGVNFYEEPVTVVGIGSMSGDVFGNGMLQSRYFKLVAAISHRYIFLDPDPDPLIAHQERTRLFNAPRGGWEQYDRAKISEGGGVFDRNASFISLSPPVQKLLRTVKTHMSGEELASAVLKIEADMLFNGGVGTYVKARSESNLEVGDKQNENVRIDANELRASAICEGGNLGLTPKARVDFARRGGFINLDAIDNSAGVDTSDHEVNLKVILNALLEHGQIDETTRVETLAHQTDMVVNRVLWNNYHQSLVISLDRIRSRNNIAYVRSVIQVLENHVPHFDRESNGIPKDEELENIFCDNGMLLRPILGILLSFAKIFMKRQLMQSGFIEEHFATEYLMKYFPKSFIAAFEDAVLHHPLHKEIVATVIANRLINFTGIGFIADFSAQTPERFILKIKSYLISNQLLKANDHRYRIYRLDYKLPAKEQYELLLQIENSLSFSMYWMLKHLSDDQINAGSLLSYREELSKYIEAIDPDTLPDVPGSDKPMRRFFYLLPYLKFTVPAIILHEKRHHRFDETLGLFYKIIEKLNINRIIQGLEQYHTQDDNEETIKRQLYTFAEFSVSYLCEKVLDYQRKNESIEEALEGYLASCDATYLQLQNAFENAVAKNSDVTLEDITLLVNALMQMTLVNPVAV